MEFLLKVSFRNAPLFAILAFAMFRHLDLLRTAGKA